MSKSKTTPVLSSSLIAELTSLTKGIGKSFVALPKNRQQSAIAKTRIQHPRLPEKGPLTKAQQWRSLLWIIDTAQAHGDHALRGLTIALARMVQAEAFSILLLDARPHRSPDGSVNDLLWDTNLPVTQSGQKMGDLLKRRRKRDSFDLGKSAVITNVWEPWRLARALQNLGPSCAWGPWRQDENHHAVAWYPWPIVWVDNGNHSATTATLKGGGMIRCEACVDATPLLRVVTTNGRQWFGENRRVLGKVGSLPMAGIFEIGRRLIRPRGRLEVSVNSRKTGRK